MATVIRPPIITRIVPKTAPPAFTHSGPLALRGKDQFFQAPGMGPKYDWPNPRGYQHPIALRTWAQSRNLGTDKFFGLAGKPNFDWPNPRGYTPAIDLRTWIEPLDLRLSGKDQFFGLAGNPNYNWPNPRGSRGLSLTDYQALLQTTLGFAPSPFYQSDWPNPRGYTQPTELKTWLDKFNIHLVGQDSFFGLAGNPSFNWPNPRGYVPSVELKTWLERYKLELIGQDQLPQLNLQWPVPRGFVPAIDLRTWIERYKLELIGQDQLPFNLTNWPNPPGAAYPTNLRAWDQGDLLGTLLFFFGNPFSLEDWPVPRGYVPSVALRTWLDTVRLNLIGKDRFFGGPGQAPANLNWPVPKGAASGVPYQLGPVNPNLFEPPPVSPDQLRQIIRFAPLAWGGKTHWTR